MNHSVRTLAFGLTAALSASGCFSYVPTEVETVTPGEDVRVYLTRQALADLEDIDIENGPVLRGSVTGRDAGQLLVRVNRSRVQEGFHSVPIGLDVTIPAAGIVQVERRELNKGGTALLVAGTAGAAAAVIALILDSRRGEDGRPDPEPPEIRIPLFSFPVP